jgi:hypothetical protein
MKDLKGNISIKAFPIEDKLWEKIKKDANSKGIKLYIYMNMILEAGLNHVSNYEGKSGTEKRCHLFF